MNRFDKQFRHPHWYKGEKITVREFLDRAARYYGAFDVAKIPAREQSDYLLAPLKYDFVLIAERGKYIISREECEYFLEKRKERIKELFADDPKTMNRILKLIEQEANA